MYSSPNRKRNTASRAFITPYKYFLLLVAFRQVLDPQECSLSVRFSHGSLQLILPQVSSLGFRVHHAEHRASSYTFVAYEFHQ